MKTIFDIKSFLLFLNKHKSYTFIDVFGLSVSLMFVIIIAIYTKQELSVDKFQENADRIYVMGDGVGLSSAYKLAYRVEEQCPEIEMVCPVISGIKEHPVKLMDSKLNADLLLVDTTFFDMFSFELAQGNYQTSLTTRQSAVISEKFARKAFAGVDPVGKTIQIDDSVSVIVTGIMKDIRNSVIPYSDIIFRIDNIGSIYPGMDSDWFMMAGSVNIFVMTHPGADIHAKEETLAEYFKEIFWIYKNGHKDKVVFVPLHDIYFSSYSDYNLAQGEKLFVIILLSVGLVILLFAVTNYVNLTVAQTGFRAKEMATRRLMGSSRTELFNRLIMESTLMTFFSYIVAVMLVHAVLPFANDLLETTIYPDELFSFSGITLSLLIILVTGFVSGLLPALVISNYKPVDVVKGAFRQKNKMIFSKFFITSQQVITISLIAVALTMMLQINHLITAPLGYNTAHIIDVDTEAFDSREQVDVFVNEVKQLGGVKQVGYGRGTPVNGGYNSTWVYTEGLSISFQVIGGDSAYFDMFGLEILQDNHLGSKKRTFANQEVFRHLGIPEDTPVLKFEGRDDIQVAGIISDFRLWNITRPMQTVLFEFMDPQDMDYLWEVLIDVQGEPEHVFSQVKDIYHEIVGIEDFPGKYLDTIIEENFASTSRTAKIIIVFSIVALVISLLGLLAISTYFIQQRGREVAIRKVFGSTNMEVLKRLILTFMNYVMIGFVIACPFIWYAMRKWLSNYDYRIGLHPWIFVVAGLFCMCISFITVFWQSYTAANRNPAESIKTE